MTRPLASERPNIFRGVLSRAGTVAAVIVTMVSALVAISFHALSGPSEQADGFDAFAALVAIAVGFSMVWRRQYSAEICVATAIAALLLPLDGLGPVIALTWVIARRSTGVAVGCGVLTAVAVGVSLSRDARRDGDSVIFAATDPVTGDISYLPVGGYIVLGTTILVLAIGGGLLRRSVERSRAERARATSAQQRADSELARAESLRTELTRQEERELIAREMHDTVAHQLSLLSLHAAALESSSTQEPVGDSAREMRHTAHRALEEMRTLISSLRQDPDIYQQHSNALADLPHLVHQARSAGLDVTATVFASEADQAPPSLTSAVYRIVQEALTNVVKHAPHSRAEVEVHAQPHEGIAITVRNQLIDPEATTPLPGSHTGLVGMRERAESLGGTFDAGTSEGWFEVRATLPWVPHPDGTPQEAAT